MSNRGLGPAGRRKSSEANGEWCARCDEAIAATDTVCPYCQYQYPRGGEPAAPVIDASILNLVRGQLVKKSVFADPILGFEILDGPYRGIVFAFTSFTALPAPVAAADGMVPYRYETEIFTVPDHLKGFQKDEAFDLFTSDIVMAWLSYLQTNVLPPALKVKPIQ